MIPSTGPPEGTQLTIMSLRISGAATEAQCVLVHPSDDVSLGVVLRPHMRQHNLECLIKIRFLLFHPELLILNL